MSKTLELAFVMAGKITPEFVEATKSVTVQLVGTEKKTKDTPRAEESE